MILAGAGIHFRIAAVAPVTFVTALLAPLSLSILVISRNGGPTPDLLLGTATASVWSTVLVQSIRLVYQERSWGTLQVLAVAPSGVTGPMVGRLVGILGQGLVAVPLNWAIVALAWGLPRLGSIPLFLGGLAESTVGLGLMGIWLFGINMRFHIYVGVFNGLFPLSVVVMGLLSPVGLLPLPLRLASTVFPSAWAQEAVRDNTYGPLLTGALVSVCWMGLIAWLLAHLGGWLRRSPSAFLA